MDDAIELGAGSLQGRPSDACPTPEGILEEVAQDNQPQIVFTIAEARKPILDWIDAQDKWYAEQEAMRTEVGPSK